MFLVSLVSIIAMNHHPIPPATHPFPTFSTSFCLLQPSTHPEVTMPPVCLDLRRGECGLPEPGAVFDGTPGKITGKMVGKTGKMMEHGVWHMLSLWATRCPKNAQFWWSLPDFFHLARSISRPSQCGSRQKCLAKLSLHMFNAVWEVLLVDGLVAMCYFPIYWESIIPID